LLRFAAGVALLSLTVMLFASGYSPPGLCGEVLRHNQEHGIDASPLFYSDVENMGELEEGLAMLRRARKDGADQPSDQDRKNLTINKERK
jgi:hypothetical protein